MRLAAMGQFFGQLSGRMSESPAGTSADDVLTVLAALVHAGGPLTAQALATALDRTADRVTAALDAIRRQPALADPLALLVGADGTYAAGVRPDRLSPAQRRAIGRISPAHRNPGGA